MELYRHTPVVHGCEIYFFTCVLLHDMSASLSDTCPTDGADRSVLACASRLRENPFSVAMTCNAVVGGMWVQQAGRQT